MDILIIMYYFIGLLIGLILILFLKEIGAIDWVYIKIAAYLKANKSVSTFGDSIYMIGGGVASAGVYQCINNDNILTGVLLSGIMMIYAGAKIREKAKNKGF